MVSENLRDIPLELICDDVICRASLEQDKSLEYALLMEAGVVFPPIVVYEKGDGTYIVGDGRTRLHGADLNKFKSIRCIVKPKASLKDIMFEAFTSNYGTGMPMRPEDAKQTIQRLMELGVSKKMVMDRMPYPKGMTDRYYRDAYKAITRKRCVAAAASMAKNPKLNVEDAAGLFQVPVKELQQYLRTYSDKGRKAQLGRDVVMIRQRYRNLTGFTLRMMKQVMDRYMAGEIPADHVREILAAFGECSGRNQKNLINWQNRFEKVDGPHGSPAPPYSISNGDGAIVITSIAAKGRD
jgi:hypothetical protein